MKKKSVFKPIQNSAGFIAAEFLFAFTMVIGIGMFIFVFTFSLAAVEISQYIVWSTARNFSAANTTESIARTQAEEKFNNLAAAFPLLTGVGASNSWFTLSDLIVGDLSVSDADFSSKISSDDKENSFRQPWYGASARINLKIFAGLKIPFLGSVAKSAEDFKFPIRAFILRHPSRAECKSFFDPSNRYVKGIKTLEGALASPQTELPSSGLGVTEDNGC